MTDLISRQALCEYALNQKDKSITPNDIMRFPSAEPSWIPVSEKLPKESGFYLVTLKTDGVAYLEDVFLKRFVYVITYDAVAMCWGYGDKNVIAWMPLPKPYEVKE